MKKVLITGKDSYIGTSVEKWLMREPDKYKVDTIDLKDKSWKQRDFSEYDSVVHVAGLVHEKETSSNKDLYFKVNRDLAYETAQKAKFNGVEQFIFLSSMSVYGIKNGVIDENSSVKPTTYYGESKLEAEVLIKSLEDNSFSVAIIRPPMVYGKGCKGNYPILAKLALITPIFPMIENMRSMIYIDNLTEFVRQLIDSSSRGLFFPQNREYVVTSKMIKLISESHNKRVVMTKWFGFLLRLNKSDLINKIFGDLMYVKSMSEFMSDYIVCDFEESIRITEE
jgi:nucleoside-diphosphate-sugar epimerase